MNADRAIRAARNNAAWCNLVSLAHGGVTQFSSAAWWNRRQGPPFYPNVVTLDPEAGQTAVGPIIDELQAAPSLAAFAVKDSFCTLDLEKVGFVRLFDASWIWKEPARPRPPMFPVRWAVLHEPAELAAWDAGWWRSAAPGNTTTGTGLYPATLLHASGVAFVAGFVDDRLAAGCALTCLDHVVGLSCAFSETADPITAESDLLSEIHRLNPGRPVVGYASGERLQAALRCGFEPVGPLRVWLRNAPRVEANHGRSA